MTRLGSNYDGNHTKLPKILLNGNNICMVSHLNRPSRRTRLKLSLVDTGQFWPRGRMIRDDAVGYEFP